MRTRATPASSLLINREHACDAAAQLPHTFAATGRAHSPTAACAPVARLRGRAVGELGGSAAGCLHVPRHCRGLTEHMSLFAHPQRMGLDPYPRTRLRTFATHFHDTDIIIFPLNH
jgi:hypothetical protein